jgi:hypothetical protein
MPAHELSRSLRKSVSVEEKQIIKVIYSHTRTPFNGHGWFESGVCASRWLCSRKHAPSVIISVLWAGGACDGYSRF